VWDSIPNFHDRWNFGPKFPVKILSITDADENTNQPEVFVLYQNYPNPFNPSTRIKYIVPIVIASKAKQSTLVTLIVYDALGKEVTTLVDEEKSFGEYDVRFDASGLPSGIYFYRLEAGSFTVTKKMLLLK
jgi:hypothetical protein